jgi:phospholipid/cholesterol/gamma-HCH transport system substrate-binding protein
VQKQAPTLGRLLTMVLFALSCFGLLLFLWLAFGGAIPLKPEGYRFRVNVPEANQLAIEADVRIAGVNVGKVRGKERAPGGRGTIVTVELHAEYAPLDADTRAIMRTKTLLGEKFLELIPGRPGGPRIPDGGRLPDARVLETVELDEVLDALDAPTRAAFRTWQQDLGRAVRGSEVNLNDAFGQLPRFAATGTDLLRVLDRQEDTVSGLVRGTGDVFAALTQREDQLRGLIVESDRLFSATARRRAALTETFAIFPTFLDESRRTVRDLESFSRQARPVVRDLRPALRDLRPTLRDVRALAPDLERFYRDLDPLITASREGLPALNDTLRGLSPVLGELQPFLEQLNPILEWLEIHQRTTADFFSNGGGALVDTVPNQRFGFERGHYLGQFGLTGPESVVANNANRPRDSRGNAYLTPSMLSGERHNREMINPSWDCQNTGQGELRTTPRDTETPPSCWTQRIPGFSTQFPQLRAADYAARGRAATRRP